MYLGQPVEQGPRDMLFERPLHPYTQALQASSPSTDPKRRSKRLAIKGELPSPLDPPSGCAFHPRCPFANERCAQGKHPSFSPSREALISMPAMPSKRAGRAVAWPHHRHFG